MNYLIVLAGAAVVGVLGGLVADFIDHTRWVSVLVGLVAGAITFGLGITKTVLEIREKHLDIEKKSTERKESGAAIVKPTKEEILRYGGSVYRQVTRKAHLIVTQRERLEPREFVADCEEERLPR